MPPILHSAGLALASLLTTLGAAEIHVAPGGDDRADGASPETAVATIQRGAELAQPGDTVLIATGTYRETVRPPRSGEPDQPIVFAAADGARVVISGTEPLAGWEALGDGRYRCAMPGDFFPTRMNQADQLFVDGEMIHEARWPDHGDDISLPPKALIDEYLGKTKDGRFHLARWRDAALTRFEGVDLTGAQVHLQPNALDSGWGWTLSGTLESLDGDELLLRTPSGTGKDGGKGEYQVGARYHLFGHPALLDAPGEWYHEREAGTLTLRSLDGSAPTEVEAKARDWGFDLSERSHVVVRGLRFFACSLTTDADAGGDSIGYHADGKPRYPWRPRGYIAPSREVVVEGCHFRYLHHFTDVSGHFFFQWGQNTGVVLAGEDHRIEGCVIERSAGNGLQLSGRRIRAIGNHIRDAGYAAVDCAAIMTGIQTVCEDMEIASNTIQRTARSGMCLRGFTATSPGAARIHHNLVTDWLLQDSDGGAYYTIHGDGGFARIDHNRFIGRTDPSGDPKGGMFFGAYFDFSKNWILDHNVITDCAVPIQVTGEFDPKGEKTSNMLIVRNTGIGNGAAWGLPFRQRLGRGSVVRANAIQVATFTKDNGEPENHWPRYGDECEAANNAVWGSIDEGPYWTFEKGANPDDLHVDDPQLDGELIPRKGSPLVDAAELPTAIERDGKVVPVPVGEIVGDGPDVGARERGGSDWTYGAPQAVMERTW